MKRFGSCLGWVLLLLFGSYAGNAQTGASPATVSGTVVDPSGARVPHAAVHLEGPVTKDLETDSVGRFSTAAPPGSYTVTVESLGFQPFEQQAVSLVAGRATDLPIKLRIVTATEEVAVPSDASSTAASDNKSALVFKGADLAALAPTDDALQKQLLAMAPGVGGSGQQIYVDGFSGGRFPPKDSIREVRINQNPFSAQYEGLGFGRIEIFTKPGSDKFHGYFEAQGNDQSFNSRNPYTPNQPPYHSLLLDGNFSGPLGKKTSFFISGNRNNQASNAVVNAIILGTDGLPAPLSQAVPNPQTFDTWSGKLDRQLSKNNTFSSRYEYNRILQTNGGVGLLVLPSEGFNSTVTTQTLQAGNTEVIGANLISETRFQYIRTRQDQNPVSTDPTVIVQGSFSGGGSPLQQLRDNQDRYEFQEYLSISHGKHFVRAGARYRLLRDSNLSRSNYNGQYIFPDLASYQAAETTGRGATQFNLTAGQPSAAVLPGDLGLYAEDEWKATEHLTLNYGFRFETQSAIPDHIDPAPRLGFAYAIQRSSGKAPVAVVRGGFGLFYDRFASGNILQSIRQNGISQQAFYLKNPTFYPAIPPVSSLPGIAPTIYRISPHLRSQYDIAGNLTLEHSFGSKGSMAVNYILTRGVHQFTSRNINAPLPGTYDPANPATAVRPMGGTADLYQYGSGGISNNNIFFANTNLRPSKYLSVFAFYVVEDSLSDVSGASAFPSQQYNLQADYARRTQPLQRLFAGAFSDLPHGISISTFLAYHSGTPFDITLGQDLNGDTQYNDRPAFATDLARPSVRLTPYGNFDLAPLPSQQLIPRNLGTGPDFVSLQVQASKSWKFGRVEAPAAAAPAAPKAPSASSASNGKAAPRPDPPYEFGLSISSDNVLNHTNPGAPVGVLTSPFFGRSISINNEFSTNSAANRVVNLRGYFRF